MDKLHSTPATLSEQGRVSLSPERLPMAFQQAILRQLDACLQGCFLAPEDELDLLRQVSGLYTPGMSEASFLLRAKGAVYAWIQHDLIRRLHSPQALYQHVHATLCRCIPAVVVTEAMVHRCTAALSADAPCDIAPIIRFAAEELLADPTGQHPLMQKLHQAATALRLDPATASRDTLRLVALHALYEPHHPPRTGVPEYLPLRLRDHATLEAIAVQTHLPVLYLREVEEATLQALLTAAQQEESHA